MRQNFRPAEREVFVVGAKIEWQNGRYWYPAVVTSGIQKDSIDCSFVNIRNEGLTTNTVTYGEMLRGYPGKIRLVD